MALPNQTNINATTSFFAPAGSGGGGGGSGIPLNLSTNNITVSTIQNSFSFTGGDPNTPYYPIYFDQLAPVGSNMPQLGIKLRQRAQDAGAIVSLDLNTDFKSGCSQIQSYWDGYIPMPIKVLCQDFSVIDETGVNLYVNNSVCQGPAFSTINIQTATINGQPYVAPSVPLYLSSTSNYSASFPLGVGQNIQLLSYDFPGITAGTYEYSVPISFNTSNAAGATPLILEVCGGSTPIYDSNTTCLFDQKTNTYVFYNLRGTVYTDGLSPAISVTATNLSGSFDIDVTSFVGPQTAVLKKIS